MIAVPPQNEERLWLQTKKIQLTGSAAAFTVQHKLSPLKPPSLSPGLLPSSSAENRRDVSFTKVLWCQADSTLACLVQLLACLLLHAADVFHVQFDPLVDPAEQLTVKISEQALLLLPSKRKTKKKKNKVVIWPAEAVFNCRDLRSKAGAA